MSVRDIYLNIERIARYSEVESDDHMSPPNWDWTQDPRAIPNANLGGGTTGPLNLFTPDFMGYGGSIGEQLPGSRGHLRGRSVFAHR
jgi:hypothetical protein